MGRVERRMYKRRKRARIRWMASLVLIAVAGFAIIRVLGMRGMDTEVLLEPTKTPVTASYDTQVEAREVLLAEETWYAIQTGVFSTEDAANSKATAYTKRGAPGTTIRDGAKWRVFIACYGEEAEAETVRARLGEMQRVETYLYEWQCPALRLRLTGPAGQLDVAEAGLMQMSQTAARLRDTAMLLDAGQLTTAEALAEIEAIDSQMMLWMDTAERRFQKPWPTLLEKLMGYCQSWQGRKKEIVAARESATALSAALKAQGMGLYDETVRFRQDME